MYILPGTIKYQRPYLIVEGDGTNGKTSVEGIGKLKTSYCPWYGKWVYRCGFLVAIGARRLWKNGLNSPLSPTLNECLSPRDLHLDRLYPKPHNDTTLIYFLVIDEKYLGTYA